MSSGQRQRFTDLLHSLDVDAWSHPTRCDLWDVADVVSHLTSTNGFWIASIEAALAGEPSRILGGFDPAATPEALVAGGRDRTREQVITEFEASAAALDATTAKIVDWDLPGEAPPGHVPLDAVMCHALWDAWVHERDVAVPLGLTVATDADEVRACLAYVVGLIPSIELMFDDTLTGSIAIDVVDPDVSITSAVADGRVRVTADAVSSNADAVVIKGDAVTVLEGLSERRALDIDLTVDDDRRRVLGGLARVFERT